MGRELKARSILIAGAVVGVLLAGCGGDEDEGPQRACSTGLPDSSAWQESGRFVNRASGRVNVNEFNSFLAEASEPVSTSPCDAARVFTHVDQRQSEEGVEFQVSAVPGDSAEAEVEVTLARLPDDSILAERWNFRFEAGEGDRIRLAEATLTRSCRPGRGHSGFSSKPCI